jgi:hypothetical protein
MNQYTNAFNSRVNTVLSPLDNPNVKAVLTLFLILYGGLAAPSFPQLFHKVAGTAAFRIVFMFLIVYIANHDPAMAILASLGFLATLNVLNGRKFFENFEGPQTAVYPSCMNVKLYDLLEAFKNDKDALLSAMQVSRVPMDVRLDDYYAPIIATYLLNRGYTISKSCAPPGVNDNIGF